MFLVKKDKPGRYCKRFNGRKPNIGIIKSLVIPLMQFYNVI